MRLTIVENGDERHDGRNGGNLHPVATESGRCHGARGEHDSHVEAVLLHDRRRKQHAESLRGRKAADLPKRDDQADDDHEQRDVHADTESIGKRGSQVNIVLIVPNSVHPKGGVREQKGGRRDDGYENCGEAHFEGGLHTLCHATLPCLANWWPSKYLMHIIPSLLPIRQWS